MKKVSLIGAPTHRLCHIRTLNLIYTLAILMLTSSFAGNRQPLLSGSKTDSLTALIKTLKKDTRGPFKEIKWFCTDGSIIPAKSPCKEPGGIQHATLKETVKSWQREGLYFGQILAGSSHDSLLDSSRGYSRIKQYEMENFLKTADEGWIFNKAQYYRGAYQAEDEEAWGREFLKWLFRDPEFLTQQFFLARQFTQSIPHSSTDQTLTRIRTSSKDISDLEPAFMNLRIKIHGLPDSGDVKRVREFQNKYKGKNNTKVLELLRKLQDDLEKYYHFSEKDLLIKYRHTLSKIKKGTPLIDKLVSSPEDSGHNRIEDLAELLWLARKLVLSDLKPVQRLHIMDLSLDVERLIKIYASSWQPETLEGRIQKTASMAKAIAGTGLLEIWEWNKISNEFQLPQPNNISLMTLYQLANRFQAVISWGTSMAEAHYRDLVEKFSTFEPEARDFLDDKIRSSVMLQAGGALESIFKLIADSQSAESKSAGPQLMSIGLNSGIAQGELVVVEDIFSPIQYHPDKIYLLGGTPSDIKPVAGILTLSQGNPVSHVQLLARSLGIPNAAVTSGGFKQLKQWNGQQVFFTVTQKGAVLLKSAEEMTSEESQLIQKVRGNRTKVKISTSKIKLDHQSLSSLEELRAKHSGKWCGPKAANLGELKHLFPSEVARGFIIPFGVFHTHMQQEMPGQNKSYWAFLTEAFESGKSKIEKGATPEEAESFLMQKLSELRSAIRAMPFLSQFQKQLADRFPQIFGKDMGKVPVFIRSDTNMEDLKEFTGAGLNLTVPNVVDRDMILNSIREVWASPYSERSFLWRQKYLKNPAEVYPSILLLESVPVEKSGVLITRLMEDENAEGVTVSINRGVGGAVDGQMAESYAISNGATKLIGVAREVEHATLPTTGGIQRRHSTFHLPVLSASDRDLLIRTVPNLKDKLKKSGIEDPYDVEFGVLNSKLCLFQVRPFVERKDAHLSQYHQALEQSLFSTLKKPLEHRVKEP